MKVYLWNNSQEFLLFPSSKCFLHYHKSTREYFQFCCCLLPNLIIFSWLVFFGDSFETKGLYTGYGCSFVKSGIFLSWEFPLSLAPWFSSSEALFIISDFDTFMMKLVFYSNLFWVFWVYLIFLYKKVLARLFNAMTSMIRKRFWNLNLQSRTCRPNNMVEFTGNRRIAKWL